MIDQKYKHRQDNKKLSYTIKYLYVYSYIKTKPKKIRHINFKIYIRQYGRTLYIFHN